MYSKSLICCRSAHIPSPSLNTSWDGAANLASVSTAAGSFGARNGANNAMRYINSRMRPPATASLLCLKRRTIRRDWETSPTSLPFSVGAASTSGLVGGSRKTAIWSSLSFHRANARVEPGQQDVGQQVSDDQQCGQHQQQCR